MNKVQPKQSLRCLSLVGLIACAVLAICAWQSGILTSPQAMPDFVQNAAFSGPVLFLPLQPAQFAVPTLP